MKLDLEFMTTQKGGFGKLRADCVKLAAKYKRFDIVAHYEAIICAIDSRK